MCGSIAVASGLAGLLGRLVLQDAAPEVVAAITALAAGVILAMVADTMLSEAFERAHPYSGLITTVAFIVAFVPGAPGDPVSGARRADRTTVPP